MIEQSNSATTPSPHLLWFSRWLLNKKTRPLTIIGLQFAWWKKKQSSCIISMYNTIWLKYKAMSWFRECKSWLLKLFWWWSNEMSLNLSIEPKVLNDRFQVYVKRFATIVDKVRISVILHKFESINTAYIQTDSLGQPVNPPNYRTTLEGLLLLFYKLCSLLPSK